MEFKGTKGKWFWIWEGPEFANMPKLMSDLGEEICNFGDDEDYYPTEGEPPNQYDALLISKAPEILEMLIETLELIKEDEYLHDTSIKHWFSGKANEIEELIKQATELPKEA